MFSRIIHTFFDVRCKYDNNIAIHINLTIYNQMSEILVYSMFQSFSHFNYYLCRECSKKKTEKKIGWCCKLCVFVFHSHRILNVVVYLMPMKTYSIFFSDRQFDYSYTESVNQIIYTWHFKMNVRNWICNLNHCQFIESQHFIEHWFELRSSRVESYTNFALPNLKTSIMQYAQRMCVWVCGKS